MSAAPNLQALAGAEIVAIGDRLCERYAAKCAARIAAEVQELEAHRQMQPTPAELDAIVKRVSARVRIELWGSPQ
jgi:hypothetical protein